MRFVWITPSQQALFPRVRVLVGSAWNKNAFTPKTLMRVAYFTDRIRIVKRAEPRLPLVNPADITSPKGMIVEIIGNLVYNAVSLIPDQVNGIITATRPGHTARQISKFCPPVHNHAVTRDPRVMRRLRLLGGVHPVHYGKHIECVDDQAQEAVRAVYAQDLILKDKDIVTTSGTRNKGGKANIVGVFHVRDLIKN